MAQAQAQVPSPSSSPLNTLFSLVRSALIPILAVIFALLIGAIIIVLSGANPLSAYGALFDGSFGDARAINRTIERATPLIFGGLAVSFAFKAGLLNIGAQGQLIFGAILAGYIGFAFTGLPAIVHIPLALLIGGLMGALWGGIPGLLKAYTGAHEVITTIMLNYVAFNITDYLSNGPWKDASPGNIVARTPAIAESAALPTLGPVPLGFVLALVAVLVVWWLIWRMTFGFELRTVGQNPNAAHYAGMSVRMVTVLALVISGALAGLGGAIETLGVNGRFQPGFNVGLGFTAITVALLARTSPFGVIPAALLIGAMQAGTSRMQFDSGVAPEIIEVVQALILFFVAADIVIRWILRIRSGEGDQVTLSSGWGQS
ncbi:MAG: ABC transporter permease [Chloroflexi bacterium AL-W]|nr:ABC transporter permease [Chloroflexi bacterium AL-N1]NOK68782.1 ABC transporter permease [Chloroflexi bacterium AL-N10]NOK76268.1 ABC transporter permease [Chloroflexi bacterium AL-N5]NOK84095.1 ABC transporter permease [Chloroflexi bacterium AL-W]NOK91406.1 ABC transporter permease [Chloroflexi bacterium AL-N15]